MKKIGLDIHGVIDFDPKFFSDISRKLVADGNEVHIITGASEDETLLNHLSKLGIAFTHFFSIVDWAESIGATIEWTDNGPILDDGIWDMAKARYCHINKIDTHIDDTPRYGEHFEDISTRFILYDHGSMSINNKVKSIIASVGECENYPCDKSCPQYLLYKDTVRGVIMKSEMAQFMKNELLHTYDRQGSISGTVDKCINDLVESIFEELI